MMVEPMKQYAAAHVGSEPDPQHPEALLPYFADQEKGKAWVAVMQQIVAQGALSYKDENAAGKAVNAYRSAHHGVSPKQASDLVPYFRYPEDAAHYLRVVGPDSAP